MCMCVPFCCRCMFRVLSPSMLAPLLPFPLPRSGTVSPALALEDVTDGSEDAPLISAVLTSLQQQVATLTQDVNSFRDANAQLRCEERLDVHTRAAGCETLHPISTP